MRSYTSEEINVTQSEPWHWMEVCDQLYAPVALLLGKAPAPVDRIKQEALN
jgi:hypothetical protein